MIFEDRKYCLLLRVALFGYSASSEEYVLFYVTTKKGVLY